MLLPDASLVDASVNDGGVFGQGVPKVLLARLLLPPDTALAKPSAALFCPPPTVAKALSIAEALLSPARLA